MKQVIITCDRCGANISPKEKQKWNLQVRYACDRDLWDGGASTSEGITWCRPCFELSGLIPTIVSKASPEEKLTLEDLIREIGEKPMNPNRRFAELAGAFWHEIVGTPDGYFCSCGSPVKESIGLPVRTGHYNLDFTDVREVLKVMEKIDKLRRFLAWINALSIDEDGDFINEAVPVGLIIDTTGKLRDLAIQWMEGRL